jgi:hypothetical protein
VLADCWADAKRAESAHRPLDYALAVKARERFWFDIKNDFAFGATRPEPRVSARPVARRAKNSSENVAVEYVRGASRE